jgi:hypothetical protein
LACRPGSAAASWFRATSPAQWLGSPDADRHNFRNASLLRF